ncbi:hypothetical protein A2477_04710 [Candidatus Falkowbacteria bacterium RIFOXYC2_FULL_47_12]|uniref:Uncharacterized protein n=2 Tax=Candidatus Falkowiibacteriota TaxID=1752728 RepID=A0A1F5TLP0_9BACT|nr:MAG: hypothetical protein A2242_04845 [Candidatus Falkowbacteria bacterium RIFOXYA2_FULL_47_9]OGF39828.1 MAG: hypothetical protein A2477_04710 [Candidatus Falkowbacteria bacterium RIFOXYC2_FULL_47_12]
MKDANVIKKIVLLFCWQEDSLVRGLLESLLKEIGWYVETYSGMTGFSKFTVNAESKRKAILMMDGESLCNGRIESWVKNRTVPNVVVVVGHNNTTSANTPQTVAQKASSLRATSLCLPMDKETFVQAIATVEAEEHPRQEDLLLIKKAIILCSDTEVRPQLESLLQKFGFACRILNNVGDLRTLGSSENSFVFIFAANAHDNYIKDWIAGHMPKHRTVIIGLRQGNNGNNIPAAKELCQQLHCRGVVIFPFQEKAVQDLLQPRSDEHVVGMAQPQHLTNPTTVMQPVSPPMLVKQVQEAIIDDLPQATIEDIQEEVEQTKQQDTNVQNKEELTEAETAAEEKQPVAQDSVSSPKIPSTYLEEEKEERAPVESTPPNPSAEDSFVPAGNGEVTIARISVQKNGDITISCSPELIFLLRGTLQKLGAIVNGKSIGSVSPVVVSHKNGGNRQHPRSSSNLPSPVKAVQNKEGDVATDNGIATLAKKIVDACRPKFNGVVTLKKRMKVVRTCARLTALAHCDGKATLAAMLAGTPAQDFYNLVNQYHLHKQDGNELMHHNMFLRDINYPKDLDWGLLMKKCECILSKGDS